jgi:FkbM family methyltransferase
MLKKVKKLTKSLFRLCGLDIRRVDPTENNYVWLAKHNISAVLDIGANTGQFAQMIHKILPHAAIFSFEPIEGCYNHLVKNMINVPNFHAFNYALGDTDTNMQMHVKDYTPSSSLLPMADLHVQAFPYTANEHIEEVKIRRLDEVAQELDFAGNLLVKIDVQGYEDRVIRGGQNVISQAKVLIVETTFERLYDGQLLWKDIFDLLSNMGFRYMGNFSQMKSPLDGSILQADSIFLKKLVE